MEASILPSLRPCARGVSAALRLAEACRGEPSLPDRKFLLIDFGAGQGELVMRSKTLVDENEWAASNG